MIDGLILNPNNDRGEIVSLASIHNAQTRILISANRVFNAFQQLPDVSFCLIGSHSQGFVEVSVSDVDIVIVAHRTLSDDRAREIKQSLSLTINSATGYRTDIRLISNKELSANNFMNNDSYILRTQGCVIAGNDFVRDLPQYTISPLCAIASRTLIDDLVYAYGVVSSSTEVECDELARRLYKKVIRCCFETQLLRIGRVTSHLHSAFKVSCGVSALADLAKMTWQCRYNKPDRSYLRSLLDCAGEVLPSYVAKTWGPAIFKSNLNLAVN